jgi:fructokinase
MSPAPAKPRQRVIVSIGEALICQHPDRAEPGGLALAMARAAIEAGHIGAAVSRVGQDAAGDDLLRQSRDAGLDIDHVQSDPDLPTGRLTTRTLAGRTTRSLTANAAFDNLQWDFDMIDLAQRADAVVFGQLARRGGQTRSVIKQFLLECRGALRVFDLTNRASDGVERGEAWTGLESCEVLVADDAALKALAPLAGAGPDGAAREIMRSSAVQVVIICARQGERERLRAIAASGESVEVGEAIAIAQHEAALMRLIGGLLDGQDLAASVRAVAK